LDCAGHTTDHLRINPSNCNAAGCRPSTIASTISGDSSVSRVQIDFVHFVHVDLALRFLGAQVSFTDATSRERYFL
jgi:hypothetical protein